MRNLRLLIIAVVMSSPVMAQVHLGIFGGAAAYNGDLTEKILPKKVTNGAIGLTATFDISDLIAIRTGVTYSVVGGADRYSKKPDNIPRNLSFETSIIELSVLAEYNMLNLEYSKYTPYFFAGVAVYKFNPYAYDANNQKVFLKPLSTEGQGLAGYPDRKEYKLTQFAIPFGGGVKFAVNDKLRIGVELGIRKLFTDYFDDVSTNYVDPADLLAAKGQLAVDMSYRGDEIAGGNPVYPLKGEQRGSNKADDYYYFTGIHLTYRLGSDNGGGGGGHGGRKSRLGCPTNIY